MKDDDNFKDDEVAIGNNVVEDVQGSVKLSLVDVDATALGIVEKTSVSADRKVTLETDVVKPMRIPPPGDGQRIYYIDSLFEYHKQHLDFRWVNILP